MSIRDARPEDAEALLEVYGWYVTHTAITYEYDIPSVQDFRSRISHTLARYPYLIAEEDGMVLGYAYAGAFHARAAYSWCAELSIYLRHDVRGRGIGRALYAELERRLSLMGILNLEACIACTGTEDEYLTNASPRWHQSLGFRRVGSFEKCGYKFGRWYDMVWMEKIIGEHLQDQPPVRFWPEVSSDS